MRNTRTMNGKVLECLPAEDSMLMTIEEMWAKMPASSKVYYANDIEVYRHHKIAQLLRDKEE
jgi:hypothetical protein